MTHRYMNICFPNINEYYPGSLIRHTGMTTNTLGGGVGTIRIDYTRFGTQPHLGSRFYNENPEYSNEFIRRGCAFFNSQTGYVYEGINSITRIGWGINTRWGMAGSRLRFEYFWRGNGNTVDDLVNRKIMINQSNLETSGIGTGINDRGLIGDWADLHIKTGSRYLIISLMSGYIQNLDMIGK